MNTQNLKSFNINNTVIVKLSEKGYKHLNDYYSKMDIKGSFDSKEYVEKYVKVAGNVIQMPLWELMQVFGSEMYNGNTEQMFESTEMLIDGDDLKEVTTLSKEDEGR